ncbi:uncharacterized protein JCM6883_007110 [Sporobolomyces salmoneus]|uniref:uncharacterized protein n=1 Tax=Sporobolomyces salmoneus TaxID=183962 RepID=UPI003178E103
MDHLARRFNDGHYYLNSLLCLPFPLVLVSRLSGSGSTNSFSSSTLGLLLLATPVLLSLSVFSRSSADNLESLHASLTFQLRLFNLFGFVFSRNQLGTGKTWVVAYFVSWLATSFFYPQPPYLGPKKIKELSSDEFDTQILLIPTSHQAALDFVSAPLSPSSSSPKIVELPDSSHVASPTSAENTQDDEKRMELGPKDRWNLVLFHAEWSKKSRELELTLSRLSHLYDSPALKFFVLSPETAPSTFYDLSLSTSPTTNDLPLLRMYREGKVVEEEPLSEKEAKRRKRHEKRENREKEKGKSRSKESDESGSDDESEDERDVERVRAVARYRWDRSSTAIERNFKLKERSGIVKAS